MSLGFTRTTVAVAHADHTHTSNFLAAQLPRVLHVGPGVIASATASARTIHVACVDLGVAFPVVCVDLGVTFPFFTVNGNYLLVSFLLFPLLERTGHRRVSTQLQEDSTVIRREIQIAAQAVLLSWKVEGLKFENSHGGTVS